MYCMSSIILLPQDLKTLFDHQAPVVLVDVRTAAERALAFIHPSILIPLHELAERFKELPNNKLIITYCHHGQRSLEAAQFLRSHGFEVQSLAGGIHQWSLEIDSTVPTY